MRNLLIPILLSLPFSAARAENDNFPEFFCAPAKKVQPENERCEDNDIFVKAAELCLKRLRAEVNKEGNTVKQFFSKGPKDKQSQNFAESQVDHANASLRLARLIRLTKKTAREVDTYFDAVWFPVDAEMDSVNGGDFEGFVMGEPCYGDTVRSLDSIMNDIVRVGRELTSAKLTADSIHGRLNVADEHIDNIAPDKVTGGRAASGAPGRGRVPAGTQQHRGSTITGEIKPKLDLSRPPPKK